MRERKEKERENNRINTYGNENMDLALRAEEISICGISKDDEQPPAQEK